MKFRNILISRPYAFLWLAVLSALAGCLLAWPVLFFQSPQKQADLFKKDLQKRHAQLIVSTQKFILSELKKNWKLEEQNSGLAAEQEKSGLIFLVYKKDSLVYWSDNSAPFPINPDSNFLVQPVNKLANGWYLTHVVSLPPSLTVVGLALIKHDYPYENDFLKNDFHSSFSSAPSDKISLEPPGIQVKDQGHTILYYRSYSRKTLPADDVIPVTLFFLLSFILVFLFIYHVFGRLQLYRERPFLFFLAFAADVILFRFLVFYFKFPAFLYTSDFFSPFYFAVSDLLPSLGDLFINVVILFFLSLVFFRQSLLFRWKPPSQRIRYFTATALTLYFIFLFFCYIYSFEILISNSSLSFTFSDPFNFSPAIIFSFIILVCLTASFYLLTFPVYKLFYKQVKPALQAAFLIFSLSLLSLLFIYSSLPLIIPLLIYVFYFFILFYTFQKKANPYSILSLLIHIICFSFLATFLVLHLEQSKEISQRKLLAQKLSTDRDPLAEYMIKEAAQKMRSDARLTGFLKQYARVEASEPEAVQYISDHYFGVFWSKYNLDFTLCHPGRILNVVIPNNALVNCQDYFTQLIRMIGKPTLSKNLYFMDYGSGSVNYLAVFPFNVMINGKITVITLYVDITSKRIPKGLGYPELLISKESRFNPDINNYSYAIYNKDELVRSFGKYAYPLNSSAWHSFSSRFCVVDANHYNHLLFKADRDKSVIISLKSRTLLDNIAPFSYFSLLSAIITLISLLLLAPPGTLVMKNQTFRNRLQLSMILLILFSFIIIGVSSGFYIVRLNHSKNIDNLTEKAHSILTEIQQKLGKSESLTPEMSNDLFFLLNKFSLVFFSDINLFDLQGTLIASSRPLIFDEGLISTKMNRQSYLELKVNQKSLFIHQDKIGNYKFLSAYLPFRNEQDKLIGYLNLPYFARQDEIRSELSAFLVAFVNLYVILVAFSIVIAIIISRYITKPMLLIRDKISQVKLGKPNEKIAWEVEDEIGGLVEEYNAMIDKLASSAEQLARSERESAWREMARQVAHEIKNPLTPMKLSVQHLLKAYDEKAPDWEQRLQRFSLTLIEQIDNLSHIATGFSDFAKMPELHKEKISLTEVIHGVIELYRDNPQITIRFDCPEEVRAWILADRNQVLRILVNLFKNSLQAIEPGQDGKITMELAETSGVYQLAFTDNGSGIPMEQQENIFSPNFTTKSGGMGLGLAMIKSIMEDHGGRISFVSRPGEGTTFFLEFPKFPG